MLPLIHCQDYDYRGKRVVSSQGTATALPVCLWLFHWAIFIYDLNFKESFNEEGFLAHCSSWAWRTKGRRGGFQNGCHRYFIRSTFAGAHKAQRSTDMLPGPAKIKDNSVFLFVSCFFSLPLFLRSRVESLKLALGQWQWPCGVNLNKLMCIFHFFLINDFLIDK